MTEVDVTKPTHGLGEAGYVTLDFIFASVLVGGVFTACFALCLTLSMVEVAQYMTFASARAYFGGHATVALQRQLGDAKWRQLAMVAPFKGLFFEEGGYFELSNFQIGDFNSEFPFDASPEQDNRTFIGARAKFRAKILEFSVPMFGKVEAPTGEGFFANVTSYLAREPATEECRDVNEARMKSLRALDQAYAAAVRFPDKYYVISDNGC